MSAAAWSAFLVAAAVGAVARALVDGWVTGRTRGPFPWGTLAFGSLFVAVLVHEWRPAPPKSDSKKERRLR